MTPISPGTLLAGRFRLEDLLEETGGARFWRATDMTLMRDVAVHVIDAADPRSPALLSAARSSATLTGPHLLRVLDAAVEDDVAYVVAEWGNGVSLDKMLLEGPLPPRQAAWMVREAADAIADAHQHGIAHGRLIPENVMVNENGSVKLIGFVVDSVLHGRHESKLSDHESDVRNLAALLYAGLVGKWPGTPGTTLAEAPRDHGRVLRARQVRAGIPTSLDRICDSVLNGAVAGYPIESAHEIKAALADFLGESGDGMPLGKHASTSVSEATQQISLPVHDPEATQASMPTYVDDEATQVHRLQPSTKTPYVGMGGGKAPSAWGPDARGEPDIVEVEEWPGEPPGTSWLRLAGLVAAVLALLFVVVFAFNLGRGGGGDPQGDETPRPGTGTPVTQALTLADVDDFDPFGDPAEEYPENVGLAHDDNPATAWTTSTYFDGPDLQIKPGVGLLVDLGSEQTFSDVELTLEGSQTKVQLLVASADAGAPSGIDGLENVAEGEASGAALTLSPDEEVTTRYLVIWLTSLPKVSDGYRGGVAEIVVRS
ncbi:MAG TPA: protein kinase family protein [Nocardioidaceae bacterium]|nr:protein kinase family protein [Nocardioidaceae bacterium]